MSDDSNLAALGCAAFAVYLLVIGAFICGLAWVLAHIVAGVL